MARAARRRAVQPEQGYLFGIVEISPSFSLSPSTPNFGRGAFAEYLQVEVEADCLSPEKLVGRRTHFTFLGNRDIERSLEMGTGAPALALGTLTMRGQQSNYLGSLPHDAAWALAVSATAEVFKFIYLLGPPLHRGTSSIRWCSLSKTFEMDDL